jgi:hypothetical protein
MIGRTIQLLVESESVCDLEESNKTTKSIGF